MLVSKAILGINSYGHDSLETRRSTSGSLPYLGPDNYLSFSFYSLLVVVLLLSIVRFLFESCVASWGTKNKKDIILVVPRGVHMLIQEL